MALHHRLLELSQATSPVSTLGELWDRLALTPQESHALVLTVLALPSVLPVPGVGHLTGSALCAWGWWSWRGRREVGLPSTLASLVLPAGKTRWLLQKAAWVVAWAQVRCRRRWTLWRTASCHRADAWWVMALGVVIFLPVPGGNVLGAACLTLMALADWQDDGLLMALAWLASALTVGYSVALVWGLGHWVAGLGSWL